MIEHGGNIHKFAKILDRELSSILDFSANINPLGFPEGLKEHLLSNLDSIVYYPDPEYLELRKEIANYLNLNPENILVGNGAIEVISLFITSIRKRAIIPIPTFSEYAHICKINNLDVEYFPMTEDFKLNIESLVDELKAKKDALLILCNPNNPTGGLIEISSLKFLLDEVSNLEISVIIDEAFIEFTKDYPKHSALELIKFYPNLCVVRSLTKFFGIPGLRLGYGVAIEEAINRIKNYTLSWSVNILADLAGRYVLKDRTFIEDTRDLIALERKLLLKELLEIKWIHPYPTQANFILTKIDVNIETLESYLLEKGILVRNCKNFEGLNKSYIRLAIKDHKSNEKLVKYLKDFSNI